MKPAPFSYVRATTRADIFRLLGEAGPDAKVIAGGQSLLGSLAFRLSQPPVLVDIGRVADLKGISVNGNTLRIGALTTHRDLGASDDVRRHAALLVRATHDIAHPAIRNRGTIGGSLAYADPATELPACVMALGATVLVEGMAGARRVPAESFFQGLFTTALADGEIITAVEVPSQIAAGRVGTLVELARRSGDYAMAGVALTAKIDAARMIAPRAAFIGLGDMAMLAPRAAAALDGWTGDEAALTAAVTALKTDLDPPADQHGSKATKLHFAGVVLARAARLLLEGKAA